MNDKGRCWKENRILNIYDLLPIFDKIRHSINSLSMKKILFTLFLFSISIVSGQKVSQEFFNALGFNVVVSKNLSKRYSDSTELFSSLLKANELDDIEKIQKMVLEKTGKNYPILSEEDKEKLILVYLKQNPDVSKKMLKQIPEFQQDVLKKATLEQIIPDTNIINTLNSIFLMSRADLVFLKPDIEIIKNTLMLNPLIKEAYSAGNPEIIELIDGLNELLKSIE